MYVVYQELSGGMAMFLGAVRFSTDVKMFVSKAAASIPVIVKDSYGNVMWDTRKDEYNADTFNEEIRARKTKNFDSTASDKITIDQLQNGRFLQ